MKTIKVKPSAVDSRLDKFLTEKMKIPRSQVQKLIKNGDILINGKKIAPHYFLKAGEIIEINKTSAKSNSETAKTQKEETSLAGLKPKVVVKTADYLIIEKPAGLPVHADSRYKKDTMIQQLIKKYPEIKKAVDPPSLRSGEAGDKTRPGIVHRIDKEVSGLMVVARTKEMFNHLKKQFQDHQVKKEYIALVNGKVSRDAGIIDFPIARSASGPMAARPKNQEGKAALTEYEIIKPFINFSLVKATIKTGRSHQIRVHFKALGHPVVGDTLYTVKKQKADKVPLDRLFLHSTTLGFTDLNGQYQEFTSKLPAKLEDYLKKVK